ncbi:hypothetical protein [Streptomyces sp. NBC_00370]|uniref:hypothetical protein n=1 Tax=Streptomyces sp. NBC_00370 TaxID=2975728 RepID=UPI002E26B214
MTLRTLITLPRMLRHGSAVGADLPPDTAVVLDPPAPELRGALIAAAAGDHRPARDLLAATRLGGEWERRGSWVPRLAASALHSPGWLDDWLAAEPENPDATLVKADLCVKQAWEIRTAARAKDVAQDQFQAFFALLDDAVPVIGAAAELNPTDPVPWQLALTHATGSQAPREVFDAYWAEAVERAPHHYGCHAAALQYLCDKWHGSHEEMFDFAERAARGALPGSQLHALPLLAAVEYDVVANANVTSGDQRIPRARIEAAIERALKLSAGYPPGDPEAAGVRNQLALMLILAGRHEESLEQFRALGVHATELPWAYFGDARREFLDFRTGVRMHVAARIPFFSAPKPAPRTRGADHTPRSLALVKAPPHKVAEAALICGVPLRIAPAAEGISYVEVAAEAAEAADAAPGGRAALLGEERLTSAADNFTTGERWPALVLRRTADRYGVTLVQRGKTLADHEWDPAAPVPDHATAAATARALAAVYGIDDIRPLTSLLRGSDAPDRRQSGLVAALGLPPLPAAFGERDEVLTEVPGAQVLARHGFFAGLRRVLTVGNGHRAAAFRPQPALPRPVVPRPRGWWTLRLLGVLLFLPTTAYAWWAPDVGHLRAVLASVATLYLGGQLTRAWRQRTRAPRAAAHVTEPTAHGAPAPPTMDA